MFVKKEINPLSFPPLLLKNFIVNPYITCNPDYASFSSIMLLPSKRYFLLASLSREVLKHVKRIQHIKNIMKPYS